MSSRYRFVLIEEVRHLPSRWRPAPRRATAPTPDLAVHALLTAAMRGAVRGDGPQPWTRGHRGDPIAFLMEAVEHPVRLWSSDGAPLYQNSAAMRRLDLSGVGLLPVEVAEIELPDGNRWMRRTMAFQDPTHTYVLEVFTPAKGRER